MNTVAVIAPDEVADTTRLDRGQRGVDAVEVALVGVAQQEEPGDTGRLLRLKTLRRLEADQAPGLTAGLDPDEHLVPSVVIGRAGRTRTAIERPRLGVVALHPHGHPRSELLVGVADAVKVGVEPHDTLDALRSMAAANSETGRAESHQWDDPPRHPPASCTAPMSHARQSRRGL